MSPCSYEARFLFEVFVGSENEIKENEIKNGYFQLISIAEIARAILARAKLKRVIIITFWGFEKVKLAALGL